MVNKDLIVDIATGEHKIIETESTAEELKIINDNKNKELERQELQELQAELNSLSQDIIQAQAGAVIDNLEEHKARFQVVHNRIREIMGKEPKVYL